MSKSVFAQADALRLLSKANKKLRSAVIDQADGKLIRALSEIIHNILFGTVKLSPSEFRKLKRYHRHLYELSKKSISITKKKVILQQHGGFLPTLLPPVLALLSLL